MKKVMSVLLAALLVAAVVPMTFASAEDENFVYVEAGAAGIGTDDDPFGTLEEAIAELDGEGGTIYVFGTYDISSFNLDPWDGMITITGGSDDAMLVSTDGIHSIFRGQVTIKDIQISVGQWAHYDMLTPMFVFDPGDGQATAPGMVHASSYADNTVDESYFVINSGSISTFYLGGGYCTSYANGVVGDTTLEINGGSINVNMSADRYMDTHTGITNGGNRNIIYNGGSLNAVGYSESHQMEVMGAMNFIFNNGMQKPENFSYPETAVGGYYFVYSAKGGMVYPTADMGVFKIKADEGKVAVIDGEQVLNGKVTLNEGETNVTWVAFDGEQPAEEVEEEEVKEEPIEIKLTIGKAEIVKNGESTALDVPAQIIDSRTMVPLRAIFEALGASVDWDDATKTVTSEKGDTKVSLTIGKAAITVNGADKALDVPAQIVESRTLVPVRAIAEAYGCEVGWDDATKTVTITK